jgi:hypothetical protein
MIHLLLLLSLCPCPVKRDAHGHIVRSSTAVRQFLWAHGHLRSTPKDSIVDHVIPLCACGSDSPDNMQMQGKAESLVKDRREVAACERMGK